MKHSFLALGTALVVLSSCGTSKKLEQANTELNQLKEVNTQQTQRISTYEGEIKKLKEENIVYSKEAAACRQVEEALRAKKQKLDQELAARGTSLKQIEDKAATAVTSLRNAPKGREALNIVAQVMYDNPGVITTIIGNTDTLGIKGTADNWSLSTERANAVVRVLSDVYNVNPNRLIAAGRSKFNPVASNDTPEGRERNRRIEIIINPRFDRIWDLLAE